MGQVIAISRLSAVSKRLKKQKKSICLVGGCFDVLHPGHIVFLQKAKREADILLVLLENDQRVKQLKGLARPVHSQRERALVLSALAFVDYVVMLPFMDQEEQYDRLICQTKPDVVAATWGDQTNYHKKRSAKKAHAKLRYVTKMVGNHSTSRILTGG